MDRRAARLVLLGILLLAAALRFHRLDAQSLWNDEGNSARIAERPLGLILEGAEGDVHPPGYYLLLHYWRALLGQSEFALRTLSVVAGLGMVLFTYLLGCEAFDRASGLGAAFVAAIAPFAIYYSQEARMYALLGAASAASTYLLLRLLAGGEAERPGLRPPDLPWRRCGTAVAYGVACVAGLYVHYAFPFVLLAHNAVFCLWWLVVARRSEHRWRWLAIWGVVQAAILLLYAPWMRITLSSVGGWSGAGGATMLGSALLNSLTVLAVGTTLPTEEAAVSLIGLAVLLIVGLWPRREDRLGWVGVAAIAVCLLGPVALFLGIGLHKPAYLKFLILALPPFHLLVSHGISNLARWAAKRVPGGSQRARPLVQIAGYALVTAALLPSLTNLYFDPAYVRDDYRQIAADIAADLRPTDSIVLSAPNQWEVFTYYYPDEDVHPAPYRPDQDEVDDFLGPLVNRHGRLYVLYWGDDESDPERLVEAGLAAQAYKSADRWYGRVRLATYGTAALPGEPSEEMDAIFGGVIRFLGSAFEEGPHAAGEIVPVTVFWRADEPVQERYKVTVQLIDDAGQLVGQHDAEPGDGLWPTTAWESGRVVTDRYGVAIPSSLLPSREYALILAIYHPATGERLSVTLAGDPIGDHLRLGIVEVGS